MMSRNWSISAVWVSASVIALSKRASRVVLMSSTEGSCIWVSGWRVAFSIALSR